MNYPVTVTSDARSQGASRLVLVAVPQSVTSVKEQLNSQVFSLYPNPSSAGNELTLMMKGIEANGSGILSLTILDAAGRTVRTVSIAQASLSAAGETTLKLNLPNGVYTARLAGKARVMTQKLIVQ
jgi:hypothetical protein